MFGSNTLEVALGLVLVFLLVSTVCTAVREGIESWLKTRAAYLEHGIRQLLHDTEGKGLAKSFYEHPLIYGLYNDSYKPGSNRVKPKIFAKGYNLPSYINSKNFAMALMDIAAKGQSADNMHDTAGEVSLDGIRKNISRINNPQVQRILLHAADTAQNDMNKMQATLEAWFNSGMDRVSGWYKRSTQRILFLISMSIVVGMNINCIKIADYLTRNEDARKIIVQKATVIAGDSTFTNHNYDIARKHLEEIGLPIGWKDGIRSAWLDKAGSNDWSTFFGPLLGWLITAFATMLGAPFWFDMLNKIMVIRSTVKPHEKSREEASEDRQLPAPKVVIMGGSDNSTSGAQ